MKKTQTQPAAIKETYFDKDLKALIKGKMYELNNEQTHVNINGEWVEILEDQEGEKYILENSKAVYLEFHYPPTPVPTTGGEKELKLEYSLDGSIFIMQDEMPIAAIQANDDNGEVILKEDEETAKEIVKRFNAFPSISFDLQCLATDKKELEEQNKVLLEALKDICGYWEDKGEDEYTLALKDNNLYQAAKAAIQSASK